jgi:transposase
MSVSGNVAGLVAIVDDESDTRLPDLALGAAVAAIEKQLMARHRNDPVNQRLARIPGVGPIIATALAATVVEPIEFAGGREFAAWLGLVPRQHSTGGEPRLGGISKRAVGCSIAAMPVVS